MTQLSNAVVLITGAAGGFGQELIRQLLVIGSRLILTDLDKTVLEQTVADIQMGLQTQSNRQTRSSPDRDSDDRSPDDKDSDNNIPGTVLACIEADLSAPEGCDRLYAQVQTLCHALPIRVDVLINNAGIAVYGRMDEVPQQQWERLMQINLLSPMRLSSMFAADMIAQQQGHIVNISSIAGWTAIPGLAHYSASKFGLRGFSEGLLNEVIPYNVRVTAVYPYFSRTPILNSARYGTLANTQPRLSADQATDPASVMKATLRAIQQNRPQAFPDRTALLLQTLKRWFPNLSNWVIRQIS